MDKRTLFFFLALTLGLIGTRIFFEQISPPQAPVPAAVVAAPTPAPAEPLPTAQVEKNEQFFVLENDYLQLVFSNIGGAIAEINLPFKSEKNPKSYVHPIEVDAEIAALSPENARFPLHPAKNAKGNLVKGKVGGFYPLLRRDTVGKDAYKVPPRFYALNIVSEYPELAELSYEVISFTKNEIVLQATQPHRRITKRFSLPKEPSTAPYCFTLDLKIEGPSQGLSLTSGVPEIEWQSGAASSTVKYRISRGKSNEVVKIDLPNTSFVLSSSFPDWVCNANSFFGLILDPIKGQEAGFKVEKVDDTLDPTRLHIIDPDYHRYGSEETAGYNVLIPLKMQDGQTVMRVFAGPFAEEVLETVDATLAKDGKTSDYLSCQTFHGWFAFISEPFAKFLFFLMKLSHSVTGSWAISIIFVTIMLRILLYPLNTWSLRSMKNMQEVAPQIKAIQDRYKKDPQRAQMEIMAIYRAKGVNPISGCLPLLLQLPFLIGMFDLLKSTYELRGAVVVPGWINDLTAPDVLFRWNTPLPLIGNEFHLLPILLGATMYIQQNVMSNLPKDPNTWTDQQRQSRVMGNIMTVVMTVLFYNFPSGLNIYWISSMLLGMLQQWWINKSIETKAVNAAVEIEVKPKGPKLKK